MNIECQDGGVIGSTRPEEKSLRPQRDPPQKNTKLCVNVASRFRWDKEVPLRQLKASVRVSALRGDFSVTLKIGRKQLGGWAI